MANAKTTRSRLRRLRSLQHSKRRTLPKQASIRRSREIIPPELRAPMTREIERQLEQLVAQFGERTIHALAMSLIVLLRRTGDVLHEN